MERLGPGDLVLVDRQRLVNSFLTTMTGPAERLSLAGAAILRLVPITTTSGNVAVAFAALSYAGRLSVTVIVDPDLVPEADAPPRRCGPSWSTSANRGRLTSHPAPGLRSGRRARRASARAA
ncbi:WS/DGAT domain-containing protein [Georgenia ruanii]|uniref:WS/DGAT domain-containing protein n=1 Tax=Georgenia ruanii TaxID=348442 RepID=UPI001D00AB3E|nr:WS/DGAT domain-containing protein [Georgenia ruanii]